MIIVLGDKWAMMACSNRPNDDDEVDAGSHLLEL